MNLNQIEANVEILKELSKIRKAMDAYMIEKPTQPPIKEEADKDDDAGGDDNTIDD